MKSFQGSISSKLPNTGTSIFAVMTQMARAYNAVNLSQGFPDFPVAEELINLVKKYMKKGHNQYALMPGVSELRHAISKMFEANHQVVYDPENEITITAGATQGLYAAISAFVNMGDEVVVFEPAYDSYAPAIEANGGVVQYVEMDFPDFKINWEKTKEVINKATKMIIINSPHNPTGSILKKEDLLQLQELTRNTNIIILSDEVYEHLVFGKRQHESVCRFEELASRSLLVGSFGKTFHATGWKVGFLLAPANLMKEFRKIHQFMVFAVNTPVQYAIAEYLENPQHYTRLGSFFEKKRDFFVEQINDSKFGVIPAQGTYFQLLDYSKVSDLNEFDFGKELITEHGLAAVPVSSFYNDRRDNKVLRFCIAKEEKTLTKAAEILCRI